MNIRMRKDTDLDLIFREGLQDAGVKAPRRVWRAVSSRINTGASSSQPRFFRFAVPAFAVLAALVVYVGISRSGESDIPSVGRTALLADSSPMRISLPDAEAFGTVPSVGLARWVPDTVPTTVTEEFPETEDIPVAVGQEREYRSATPEPADDYNYWNSIANEPKETSKSRRIHLGMSGSASGNNLSSTYIRPMMSSGYSGGSAINEESVSTFSVPVSAAVSMRYFLTDRLAVNAGVGWTLLTRSFSGSYRTAKGRFTHMMQYVGIPVSVSYNLLQTSTMTLYVYGGGSVEKAVSNKYYIYSESSSPILSESVDGLQYGIAGGFGMEFRLADRLGLYVDPAVDYYFAGQQPKSIRTEKPLMFSVEAGLRFRI